LFSAEIGSELVDFVEDEHGVLGLGAAETLDDLPGQCSDVGSPMAADFRLVAHAAERDADELAPERVRNRLGERGLSDSGRPEEAEDRPFDVRVQLSDGEIFDDAVLHLFKAGVIGVQDLLGAVQVEGVFGALRPGQCHEPVQVGARDRVFGGRDRHLGEPIELTKRFLLDQLRHAGAVDLRAKLVDVLGLIVSLAQLFLDRLELLAEEVLALILADLGLDLRLNLRPELENLELLDQHAVERVHPRADIERVEDLLLHGGADRRQARRDEVGELAGLGDVRGQRLEVVGQQRRERHDLLEVALDVPLERIDLQTILVAEDLLRGDHRPLEIRAGLNDTVEANARQALDDQPQAAVRQLEHLVDVSRGADRIEIVLERFLDRRFALGEYRDHATGSCGLVDEPHGSLAGDRQRHEGVGEEDRVTQRQYRQVRRDRERPLPRNQQVVVNLVGLIGLIAHGRPS
jgi:hypothetical protein